MRVVYNMHYVIAHGMCIIRLLLYAYVVLKYGLSKLGDPAAAPAPCASATTSYYCHNPYCYYD